MTTPSDISVSHRRALALLDAGRPADALSFAQHLPGNDPNSLQVLALTEIEAGEQLGDRDVVRRGIDRLDELEQRLAVPTAYSRANGHFVLWTTAVRSHGVARAHAEHRTDLHAARDLYGEAGVDDRVDDAMRCQALVNLGNSYDGCGRHAEALDAYSKALSIRPGFTMALGNRGTTLLHRAALETVHHHALTSEAVAALDAALADPEDLVAHGGPAALASFKAERARISGTPSHEHDPQPLEDAYLEWCRTKRLFLHPS